MNRKSTQAVGAMHPILFFLVVYGISLFLAFFICNTVYSSLHPETTDMATAENNASAKADYLLSAGKPATALH